MRIYTGTIGDYTYTAEVPESTVFIFSRHTYARVTMTDSSGKPASGLRIQGVVQIGPQMYTGEYRYTDSNGKATFDFAAILQTAKNDRDKELTTLAYETASFAAWQMTTAYIKFYLDGAEMRMASRSYELVNGSHDNIEDWWTATRRLKWWTAYPFTFDFTNQSTVAVSARGGVERQINVPYIETSMMSLLVRFNPAAVLRVADRLLIRNASHPGIALQNGIVIGTDNEVLLDVDTREASDRCTYLRWLGMHGEVFYWLFDNVSESTANKAETFRRTMTDDTFTGSATNYTRDNGIIRDCSTSVTRQIATDMLDGDYYDLVSSIGGSVAVDMYLGGNNRWQRVNVSDMTTSKELKYSARGKRNRIALTIEISER